MSELVPYLPIILGCILLATIFVTAHVSVYRFNRRKAAAAAQAAVDAETREPSFFVKMGIQAIRRGQTGRFYGGGDAVSVGSKLEKA